MSRSKIFVCILSVFCFFVCSLFSQETGLGSEYSESGELSESVADFGKESEGSQVIVYTERQQALRVTADDVKLVPEEDPAIGGYHLYIKKLPHIQSVLLTETTRDPNGKNDNYTYRAKEYNKINGDEIRLLDGDLLRSDGAKYSLVDSSPEYTEFFGDAFHIYIPPVIEYGYPWTRHGEVEIKKGTFINVRAFDKPFADYTGSYMDSPFMFDVVQLKKAEEAPKPEPEYIDGSVKEKALPEEPEEDIVNDVFENIITDDYNHIASAMLKEISHDISYSKGPETIVDDILNVFDKVFEKGNKKDKLDVVFAIDATGSMKNDINKLKADLLPALEKYFGDDSDTRIGLLFYRDYGDTFNYKNLPVLFFDFTTDFKTFAQNLNSIRITGLEGGDIPEAVYEAIYASTRYFNWRDDADKQIIIIGDAEPHPTPRGTGKYSKDYVMAFAEFVGVTINTILLPKD